MILARCSSQDLTWIRLGVPLSLSAGVQSSNPALRAPLTNNSASFSAMPPASLRYHSAIQVGSNALTLAAAALPH